MTSPIASTTCSGNSNCNITWQDDNTSPTLAEFGDAVVGLYVGSTDEQSEFQRIVDSVNVNTTSTIAFTVDPSIGEDSSN